MRINRRIQGLVKADKSKKKGALKEDKYRKERLLKEVENIEIKVEYIPEPMLTKMALADYNTWHIEKRKTFEWASGRSARRFQQKIRHNYIRHNLTNYNLIIQGIARKIHGEDEYTEIRSILLKRIKERWLAAAENEKMESKLSASDL